MEIKKKRKINIKTETKIKVTGETGGKNLAVMRVTCCK